MRIGHAKTELGSVHTAKSTVPNRRKAKQGTLSMVSPDLVHIPTQ